MAKRFTDTDKWRKPFFKGLPVAYKVLWLYLLDDCDIAGIWICDFEVARLRTGEDISEHRAIEIFGNHIKVFDDGRRWLIRDFIEFQYGELSPKNRMHSAVIKLLQNSRLGPYKGLPSPQGYGQGEGHGQGQGEEGGAGGNFEERFALAFDENQMTIYKLQFQGLNVDNELAVYRLKCNSNPSEYHKRDSGGLRNGFLHQLTHTPAARVARNGRAKSFDINELAP